MRTEMCVLGVLPLAVLAACVARPDPVPVRGSAAGLTALAGAWSGWYEAAESGRAGSIAFALVGGADTARGDVVMIPRGWREPIGPAPYPSEGPPIDRSAPEVLTIAFVEIADGEGRRVVGAMDPYRDPECGCTLRTTFTGLVRGDTVAGTFSTRHLESGVLTGGRWLVVRRR